RGDVVQKLPHLRQDPLRIARSDVRLQSNAHAAHLVPRWRANAHPHAELCPDLDAEVGQLLLLGLRHAALVDRVTDAVEDIRTMLQKPRGSQLAAAFLVGNSEE